MDDITAMSSSSPTLNYECRECFMQFDNATLLARHKRNFCTSSKFSVKNALSVDPSIDVNESQAVSHQSPFAKLKLSDVRRHFDSNKNELERLKKQYVKNMEADKIEKLKDLKIKQAELRSVKNKEEQALLLKLREIQERKESELRALLEKEQTRKALKNLDRQRLTELERHKKKELDGLAREREYLATREAAALKDIAELEGRMREQEAHEQSLREKEHSSSISDTYSNKTHPSQRQRMLAEQRGSMQEKMRQRNNELLRERGEVEKQLLRIQERDNNVVVSESESVEAIAERLKKDPGRRQKAAENLKCRLDKVTEHTLVEARKVNEEVNTMRPDTHKELKLNELRIDDNGYVGAVERSNDEVSGANIEVMQVIEQINRVGEEALQAAVNQQGVRDQMKHDLDLPPTRVPLVDFSRNVTPSDSLSRSQGALLREKLKRSYDEEPVSQSHQSEDSYDKHQQKKAEIKKEGRFDNSDENGILADITAMRQDYLRQGGSDPGVLSQMLAMEQEAMGLKSSNETFKTDASNTMEVPMPSVETTDLQQQLWMYEMENTRLQEELRLCGGSIHMGGMDMNMNMGMVADKCNIPSAAPPVNFYGANIQGGSLAPSTINPMMNQKLYQQHVEHASRLLELQHEKELIQQEMELRRLRAEIKRNEAAVVAPIASGLQDPDISPVGQCDLRDGFYVFFDFVLGLPQTTQQCNLAYGLFDGGRNKQAVRTIKLCECEVVDETNSARCIIGQHRHFALSSRSTKLGLVFEVQVPKNGGKAHNNFISLGWTRLPLFDSMKTLLTGRWRVSLRASPIRPSMREAEVNSLPKIGDLEAFLRVVDKGRFDYHAQYSINDRQLYKYLSPSPLPIFQSVQQQQQQPIVIPQTVRGVSAEKKSINMLDNQSMRPSLSDKIVSKRPISRKTSSPSSSTSSAPLSLLNEASSDIDCDERAGTLYTTPSLHSSSSSNKMIKKPTVAHTGNVQGLGLRLDKLVDAVDGPARVRMTAYQPTGDFYYNENAEVVTAISKLAKMSFELGVIKFMEMHELAIVSLKANTTIIFEVLVHKKGREDLGEIVACWTSLKASFSDFDDSGVVRLCEGHHKLQLFYPPAAHEVDEEVHEKFGDGIINVVVYTPGHLSLVLNDGSHHSTLGYNDTEDDDIGAPPELWIESYPEEPPSQPFLEGDGFDLYIDSARLLPDNVTISKVAGRIFDENYTRVGPDINTSIELDSSIYDPVFDARIEFREERFPPSSTLLLKVYTVDLTTKELCVLGYCTLNLFFEAGSTIQPKNKTAADIALNEGGHQLRIYSLGPDPNATLSCYCLERHRAVPLASLLIRIKVTPKDEGGQCMCAKDVARDEWERCGLVVRRPAYHTGAYYSANAAPTVNEIQLFEAVSQRKSISVRDVISLIGDGREKLLKTEKSIISWIKTYLTRFTSTSVRDLSLTFISKYRPQLGFKFAVDAARGLPKAKYTQAIFCISPPATFFNMMNKKGGKEKKNTTKNADDVKIKDSDGERDLALTTERPRLNSLLKSPMWDDGWRLFQRRVFSEFSAFIIELFSMDYNDKALLGQNKKQTDLVSCGWTALNIFSPDGYVFTDSFQLPLFQGSPSVDVLTRLNTERVAPALAHLLANKKIHLFEHASIFVRLVDSRRDGEFPEPTLERADTSYLPVDKISKYSIDTGGGSGKTFSDLTPKGHDAEDWANLLSSKFSEVANLTHDAEELMNSY